MLILERWRRELITPRAENIMDNTQEDGATFKNLRLVKARLLAHHLLQRPHLLNHWTWINALDSRHAVDLAQDEVVYHSWLPGFILARAATAECIREMIAGTATAESGEEHLRIATELAELGWLADTELDLEALLTKVRQSFFAWQNPRELGPFLAMLQKRRPKAVLEIGTAAGGLFYCLSQVADPSAVMISMDSLGLPYGGGQTNMECEVYRSFGPPTQRFEFIRNRSFHYASLKKLEEILDGQKLDLLFIDADHSYSAASSDFEIYRPCVADDGLIALHDIVAFPTNLEEWRYGNDVAVLWEQLTGKYQTQTFIDDNPLLMPSRTDALYQSGRWPALGIGVVFGNRPIGGKRRRPKK